MHKQAINFKNLLSCKSIVSKTLIFVLIASLFSLIACPSYAKGVAHRNSAAAKLSLKNVMKNAIKKAEKNALLKESQVKAGHNSPHLPFILKEVEKRKLPKEIAYLPVIESNFQTSAVSNKGAMGLWQLMPETAKQYGLERSERSDVEASTKAALSYLEYLHKKFNRDWTLALAAYNAGEGRVARAIKSNKSAGKSTGVLSLKLPKETRDYIGKYQILKRVLKQPSFTQAK